MNPVNATALYVSVCRSVLQSDPLEPQSVAELCKLLPFFRQSLSCLVCGNLLHDPIAPTNSSCQHYVCKGCKGRKMTMKPSCSWCKDYEQFEENKQLSILVDCYRKLCEYIVESPLAQHIANTASGPPDILAILSEGFSLGEGDPEDCHLSVLLNLPQSSLVALSSEDPSKAQSQGGNDQVSNGNESGTKPKSFSHTLPASESMAAEELCTEGIDICGFSEAIKHNGDPLMLSVEEVLQTLEPDPEPVPDVENCPSTPRSGLDTYRTCNGPSILAPCQLSLGVSSSTSGPQAARLNRKRSRSESDSEKVQPLPISSIIQASPLTAAAAVAVRRDPKLPTVLPLATVPNGGGSKVGKTLLVSLKGSKKAPDHTPRKVYTKAKQGVSKTKDKTKDHHSSNSNNASSMSGSPTKVVYKKPQEKKGCKCGRATQNPSVLTCRGQRCPCYSNRKACLDCICRGCQNSYMANGEKKLEAFAVPEKALEQTRLTLGINVTSIAVRNAGTSGSVLNMTATTPMASFLAASSHEEKTFEDSLDMRAQQTPQSMGRQG
ncbi:E3 ubiquitin-protein ligase MSL2-like isoform X1 [Arapaima gigas]